MKAKKCFVANLEFNESECNLSFAVTLNYRSSFLLDAIVHWIHVTSFKLSDLLKQEHNDSYKKAYHVLCENL
jgi:hypothetical protein